jgi:L-iditol 2-dehydrogenase
MTDSMRAAVLRNVRDVVTEERPMPVPGPREVLVRVSSVGVCGSDVHYFEHGRIGDFVVNAPLVLGHEASGEVVAVGSGTNRALLGKRVSLEPGVPDLTCEQCRAGRYNLCPNVQFFATPPVDGAFCEYVTILEEFAHPVPDAIDDDAAALLEPLSVGIWACRKGEVTAGSRVLVTGAGPIGLMAAEVARAFGAAEVVVTDVNAYRLALATDLGATGTIDVGHDSLENSGFEPDVLLECSGNAGATVAGIRSVTRGGHVVLVGMGGGALPLPVSDIQTRELRLTGTFRYANTWPSAIALTSSGAVDLNRLVTGHHGLGDVTGALTGAATDDHVIKAVVTPWAD